MMMLVLVLASCSGGDLDEDDSDGLSLPVNDTTASEACLGAEIYADCERTITAYTEGAVTFESWTRFNADGIAVMAEADSDGDGALDWRSWSTLDAQGNPILVEYDTDLDDTIDTTYTRTWDEAGHPLTEVYDSGTYSTTTTWQWDGELLVAWSEDEGSDGELDEACTVETRSLETETEQIWSCYNPDYPENIRETLTYVFDARGNQIAYTAQSVYYKAPWYTEESTYSAECSELHRVSAYSGEYYGHEEVEHYYAWEMFRAYDDHGRQQSYEQVFSIYTGEASDLTAVVLYDYSCGGQR